MAPRPPEREKPVRMHRLASVVLLVAITAGCSTRRNVPELLTLTDVLPSKIDVGERVDVMGVDLPSAEAREGRVILRGDLYRPGRAPLHGQVIEIDGAEVSPDRVSFEVNDALSERIVGRGEEALHTTFRGTLEVSLPSAASSTPVFGTLHGTTTLDFFPRTPRTAVVEEREHDARAALDFLGVDVAEGRDGLLVTSVAPESPAAKAGIATDDRILSFEGVTSASATDLVPSGTEREPVMIVARKDDKLDKAIDVDGWKSDTTRDLVPPALVLGSLLLILLLLGTPPARVLSWLARRIERGAVHHKAETGGLFARFSRFVTSVVQDQKAATKASSLAVAAPFVVIAGVSATFAFLPYVELHRRAELDVGVLFLLSVTSYATMALVTGGHDATLPWSPLASLRAFVRALVCELPAALSVAAVVLLVGSLRMRDIVQSQVGPGGALLETGAWPWYFHAVKSPGLVLLFVLFFVTVLVEPQKRPPLAGGSLRQTAFLFAEWTNVFVMCALATALFFGGWYLPGVAPEAHESNGSFALFGTLLYLAKSWLLVGIVMTKRVSLPRVRSSKLFGLGLRYGLPLAIVCLGLTALQALYPPIPTVALILSGITLVTTTSMALLFAASLVSGGRVEKARTTANAIL